MNKQHINIFLETLYSNIPDESYINIRPIREKKVKDFFFKKKEIPKLIKTIEDYESEYHIFMGVLPRNKKSGKNKDVDRLTTFWVDIDAKDFEGDKEKAYDSISLFPLTPTLVVDSGNGYHAYWVLKEPLKIDKDNRPLVKGMVKKLHKVTKADDTHDLARILRVPGTANIKDPKNFKKVTSNEDDWTYAEIKDLNITTQYSFEKIKKELDAEEIEIKEKPKIELNNNAKCEINSFEDVKRLLSDELLLRAETVPDRYETDRSTNDYWVALKMYNEGFNDIEIYNAFKIFASKDWDAGKKFKSDGDGYLLDYTLPNAKSNSVSIPSMVEKLKEQTTIAGQLNLVNNILPLLNSKDQLTKEVYINKIRDIIKEDTGLTSSKLRAKMRTSRKGDKSSRFYTMNPETGRSSFVPRKLGQYLLSKFDLMHLNDTMYVYQDGVYSPEGYSNIKEEIQNQLGDKWKRSYREETMIWLNDACFVAPDDPVLNNEDLINVKNGMLDVRSGKLHPHDPCYKSIQQINVSYDPEAKSDLLERFMDDVFVDENVKKVIWEHAGYILIRDLELKKFLILLGHKNNGKSVWLNLIENIIGKSNISNEDLQSLSNNRFASSNLYGKMVNINADMDSQALKYTGTIKQLTGGDTIRADQKFRDTFSFKNKAKLFFSCNSLPYVNDYNQAFFSRLHIVFCPNTFIKGENADPEMLDKLSTEEVKSAWLNKAIEAARRLYKTKKFTYADKVDKQVKAYMHSSDSSTEFANLLASTLSDPRDYRGDKNTSNYLTKKEVFGLYINWCSENGRAPVSVNKFNRRLKEEPNLWVSRRTRKGGTEKVYWINLRDIDSKFIESYGSQINIRLKNRG